MYDFKKSKDGVLLEGFLNCENKAEILFIMKEPNSEEQKDFWFWKGNRQIKHTLIKEQPT